MPEAATNGPNLPLVTEAESGQKLMRLLERRLNLPQNLLHRWLRTGQIRLNGKRAKPFEQVSAGDRVRVPPFAYKLAANCGQTAACAHVADGAGCAECSARRDCREWPAELPPLLGRQGAIWAFSKPAGLAVQPGTAISVNMADLLASHYSAELFCPAPAHRLDRETSGVLLVGASHAALQELQRQFAAGAIHKEYLAWVRGQAPWHGDAMLRHYLRGKDHVIAYDRPVAGSAEARCLVRPLRILPDRSLLQIRLLTGRKRQLRSQLAACGLPIIGDRRYGQPEKRLLLHACRVMLPGGAEFSCLPDWQDEYAIRELPPQMQTEND
ncbi:MAG: RluA family pseudouridine synthase [Desulfovibrio sp.]|nr:RluA family pseudouridine synthase [Desulfovibrio sp.]